MWELEIEYDKPVTISDLNGALSALIDLGKEAALPDGLTLTGFYGGETLIALSSRDQMPYAVLRRDGDALRFTTVAYDLPPDASLLLREGEQKITVTNLEPEDALLLRLAVQ